MGNFDYAFPPMSLIGERFLVIARFEGGMSEVYQCLDREADGQQPLIALKTLKQAMLHDEDSRERFRDEVQHWTGLGRHPNLVHCIGFDYLEGNVPFMYLEWISPEDGRPVDLRGWLRYGTLPVRQTLEIALDVIRGLIYANQVYADRGGMIHLDIKPDNILIAPGQIAKVTDFGLSKLLGKSAASRTGFSRQGTPYYMAPEQWEAGAELNVTTDIYGFGCMFYEMLAGSPPFTGSGVRQMHLNVAPDLARIPFEAFHEIVARCLSKTQADRYPSFEQLYDDLVALFQNFFVDAPPSRSVDTAITAADHSNRAATYLKLNSYESALNELNAALKLEPDNAFLNAYKGLTHSQLGQHDQALHLLMRAIDDFPDNPQIEYMLGMALSNADRIAEAFTHLDKAASLDPNHIMAIFHRSVTLARLERTTEAIQDITMVIRLRSTIPDFYYFRAILYRMRGQAGDFVLAVADLTRALEQNRFYIEAYRERAELNWIHLRKRADALADLNAYIDVNPDNFEVYNRLSEFQVEFDLHQDAVSNLSESLRLKPDQFVAHCLRGHAYSELGRYPEALQDFEKAISLNGESSAPYSLRGIAYNRMGERQKALDDFAIAAQLDPADLVHMRGRTVLFAESEMDEQGENEISKLIIAAPDEKWAYYVRAYFYTRQKKTEKALADYEHALAIDPEFTYSRIARGMLLIDLDRLDEAAEEFRTVMRRDPRNYHAIIGVGKLQERHGNHRSALDMFERAARLGDPGGRYYYDKLAKSLGLPVLAFDPLTELFKAIVNSRQMGDLQQAVRDMPFLLDEQFFGWLYNSIIRTPPQYVMLIRRNLDMLKRMAIQRRRGGRT